ncbi:N-formylmaleamate deformylase [Thermocatellispora tengchongensis]|uniref:N-formylmaleamate deformylase n=1 Tax=Thermocatellispora tengchongensis TaxID=1073253 RepID=A0A840PFG0_9ACTN|nr:alpha/beta hydrolase [Thermocatellispora tengchongensis]MBB5137902.1 N-formylmaleamate deformylase [Thermocatellispora tengchongensis]
MSACERGRRTAVHANGLRHEVLLYNEDADRDLYLVPGITSPAVTADFVAVELAAMGLRVAVPDVRGRGGSDVAPSGGYTLADYTEDAVGVIRALGLRDPVLLGHSMGARIVAAASPALPGAGPVILVDPPVSGPGRRPYPTTREQFLRQLHEAKAGTDAEAVRRFYPRWPERELRIRAQVLASCDETAVVETHRGFETEEFHPHYAALAAPAVLVRGADSPVLRDEDAAELSRLRPDIPIVSVPAAGHMVPWDNLAGFLDAVRPFAAPAR